MAEDKYDRTIQDVGNIVALEHVNVTIPDQVTATNFWITGMGFTRDPYLMVGTDNMWVNIGQQQFHLPTNQAQVLRGTVDLVVPGTPVYYAPAASNLFVYGGSYYTLHNGHWFFAKKPGAAWLAVATDKVPKPVMGVPVSYYKVPPGHLKKMGDGDGHGKGWKKGKGH